MGPADSPANTRRTGAARAGTCSTKAVRRQQHGDPAGAHLRKQFPRHAGACVLRPWEHPPHERELTSHPAGSRRAWRRRRRSTAARLAAVTGAAGWRRRRRGRPPSTPTASPAASGAGQGLEDWLGCRARLCLLPFHLPWQAAASKSPTCSCLTGKAATQLRWLPQAVASCCGESACGMLAQRPSPPNCQPW